MTAQRFFNTAGPVNPKDHYCLSPFDRFNRDEVMSLVEQKKYFILHAPRQTGKTSALIAFMNHLNTSGDYRCVYTNVEIAQAAREDVAGAMQAILSRLSSMAMQLLQDGFVAEHWQTILKENGPYAALTEVLARWSEQDARPLIVLIDEIDALIGDTLIAVLRQLREGYAWRSDHFPQSIVLCGIRDVRDYRIHSSREKTIITGGSAFNVKAESLRLGDFSEHDVHALYQQHTDGTEQEFTAEAMDRVWALTQGQPWLVNALAYETCFRMVEGRDRTQPITLEQIEHAKENLILRRETHLDQLTDKLQEERVQRVIEPLLDTMGDIDQIPVDDLDYVRDLGLIRREGEVSIANPIYQEIIPRQLIYTTEAQIHQPSEWYIQTDGRLDMARLLTAFQAFFREHSEHWVERFQYKEAGPQLLLQAFLQRIVNGGGRIEREYGLGRMRTDLLVIWPYSTGVQRIVLELKLLHKTLERTITTGLQQTWQYMDRCGVDEGHLVVFDRTPDKAWDEKLFLRSEQVNDVTIQIWGM